MKPQNAAVTIREMLGCYNIILHKQPAHVKPKKISFGEIIRMAAAKRRATPERLARHLQYLASQ